MCMFLDLITEDGLFVRVIDPGEIWFSLSQKLLTAYSSLPISVWAWRLVFSLCWSYLYKPTIDASCIQFLSLVKNSLSHRRCPLALGMAQSYVLWTLTSCASLSPFASKRSFFNDRWKLMLNYKTRFLTSKMICYIFYEFKLMKFVIKF